MFVFAAFSFGAFFHVCSLFSPLLSPSLPVDLVIFIPVAKPLRFLFVTVGNDDDDVRNGWHGGGFGGGGLRGGGAEVFGCGGDDRDDDDDRSDDYDGGEIGGGGASGGAAEGQAECAEGCEEEEGGRRDVGCGSHAEQGVCGQPRAGFGVG